MKEANGFASPSRQLCLPKKKRHHAHSMPINTPQISNLYIQFVSENKKAEKEEDGFNQRERDGDSSH